MISSSLRRAASSKSGRLLWSGSRGPGATVSSPPAPLSSSSPSPSSGRRSFATEQGGGEKKEAPFGLGKLFGLGEPDNLIATDRDRRIHKGDIPDFLPADVKKDLDELGIDNIHELDELEEANLDGYNDLGLVPPEDTGTFASPILIPSRRSQRQVGYVDPESHATFWFTIHNDDNTYYIKDLGLFFKMLHIPDEEAFGGGHH